MVLLKDTRQDLWLKGTPKLMVSTDYYEAFSPTARLNYIYIFFSLAVNLSWSMYQLDVQNAFLYGDLNETVYMEQPPGYVAQEEDATKVCCLKKAIQSQTESECLV